ncbi:glycosyltransferase [bacterium]|nr:glycosyltransferase [bacterium]
MKIAMLTTWSEPCGIADYAKGLVAALKPQAAVDVIEIKHGRHKRDYFRKLGQACVGYDLVHIQHEYVFFGGRDPWNADWKELIRHIKVPYIVTVHTWLRPFSGGGWIKRSVRALRLGVYTLIGWQRYLEAGQFKGAVKVIVHTQAFAQALMKKGIAREKVQVMDQGIPGAPQFASGLRAKARWGLAGQVVTLFGFLIPSKGHLLALEAWQQAPENTTLMIVGKPFSKVDTLYAEKVKTQANTFPGTVKMTGYLEPDDLADLLLASDLVILPYTAGTASYSLSVVLAHGCVALTSDIECFQELSRNTAMLETFPNRNAAALATQLKGLLQDSVRRQKLRENAANWVQAHQWEMIASLLIHVYTEVMQTLQSDDHV